MNRISAAVLMFVFCLLDTAGFAQNATMLLRGAIKDPSGAVVPGATITLSNGATGQTITTTSRSTGEYQLQQILPAKYLITVVAPGFSSQSKTAELLVNQTATIDFALSVQGSTEVVDVTEAAQTLNATDASLGGTEDKATIPKGRTPRLCRGGSSSLTFSGVGLYA
jgi:hypothetical protein